MNKAMLADDGARGGIILGWLIKIVVVLLAFGFVAFEIGAIVIAKVGADSVAIEAADEAGLEYGRTGSSAKAEKRASEIAATKGATVVAFSISRDGRTVTVTVRKIAHTIVMQRIGFLRTHTIVQATHTGNVRI